MFIATDNQFTARGRLVDSPQINISEKTGNAIVSITLAQEHPFKKMKLVKENLFLLNTPQLIQKTTLLPVVLQNM